MSVSNSSVAAVPPPFALAASLLPLLPLQLTLGACLREICDRHPHIFDRLGPYAGKRFGLEPTDLPIAFVLEPRRINPQVRAVRTLPHGIDARIAGPLAALIGMVEGSYDGDALFFSRDIQVEGDMEAVIALRNAIDDSRIDLLAESVAWLGPLRLLVERFLRIVVGAPSVRQ
jgi:O2-independent ubiquinone biosynthesis accessory factor UbiT